MKSFEKKNLTTELDTRVEVDNLQMDWKLNSFIMQC